MKHIPQNLVDDLIVRAGAQARRRTNLNIHAKPEDPIQRLFIAAKLDSYFRPHRHPTKWEFVIVVRGQFDILTFAGDGSITERFAAGPDSAMLAFELPASTWHTSVPMQEDSVFLEIKQGPYDARTVSEFADWSPAEGAAGANRYLERLRLAKVGECIA